MNSITVLGNLAADPTIETVGTQSACKFRVGAQNSRKDQNGQYGTNWYNCTMWGKRGETIAKFFHKGDKICFRGDLAVREYVDRNGGKGVSLDVSVDNFDFVGARNGNTDATQPRAATPAPVVPQNFTAVETDELPF